MNRVPALEQAREKIDRADEELFPLLAKFNLASSADKDSNRGKVPSTAYIAMWRHNAPRELLNCVIDELDLISLDAENINKTVCAIARSLSKRFQALEGIAHSKKAKGETNSFCLKRHKEVVHRGAEGVEAAGGSAELGRKVFATIAQKSVEIQDEYLQAGTGPLADYLNAKAISKNAPPSGWLSYSPTAD